MGRIYNRAEDKNVATRVVYLKTSDSKLYYDSAYTEAVAATDMPNLFLKGVVLYDNGAYKAATSYDSTNGITFAELPEDENN